MNPLTETQIRNLHLAIDRAEGFKECRYTDWSGTAPHDGGGVFIPGTKPVCVIGQLAVLEGITPTQMNEWFGPVCLITLLDSASALKSYSSKLLDDIQRKWDSSPCESADEARTAMRDLIADYIRETTT
jgi:hypothetical protein